MARTKKIVKTRPHSIINSFYQWLMKQKDRDDSIGHLARWAGQQPDWPARGSRVQLSMYIAGVPLGTKMPADRTLLYEGFIKARDEFTGDIGGLRSRK